MSLSTIYLFKKGVCTFYFVLYVDHLRMAEILYEVLSYFVLTANGYINGLMKIVWLFLKFLISFYVSLS